MAVDQAVQAVAAVLGKQLARELDRAQHAREVGQVEASELGLEKTVVEARVVRDQDLVLQAREQVGRKLRERGRVLHHFVGDAGERLDEGRNALLRIHQLAPAAYELALDDFDQSDLGDALLGRTHAGGLEVEENQRGT